VRDGRFSLSGVIHSQADMHAVYGGVVPEIASRSHIEVISALAETAILKANITKSEIDAVAATFAPGLIGALLVGLNFAKGAALSLGVPFIPVHHLRGHVAANYLAFQDLEPPFLAVVLSGGNTVICHVKDYTDYEILGKTRDDAAGECFDKAARLMGLGYPGGQALDKLAESGDNRKYSLPRPVVDGAPLDMSFSGLKTAVVNLIHNASAAGETLDLPSLAASLVRAVSEVIVPRAINAARQYGLNAVAVSGGVAANSRIRADLSKACAEHGCKLYIPPMALCGDNAEMIGAQAYYEYKSGIAGSMETNAYATKEI